MNNVQLMKDREQEIGELVTLLSEKSRRFTKPPFVLIGGYALRAFVPFSRYSRDCDFALKEGLDLVAKWKPDDVHLETFERRENHGFMRWFKLFGTAKKKAKLGVDFMEGQVRGREGEAFLVDDDFLAERNEMEITIGDKTCSVFVPSYPDYFVLKVMASRSSDIRDIAALVRENNVPESPRLSALNDEAIFRRNLMKSIIPEIESKNFLDSWKGTFITEEFTDEDRKNVAAALRRLLSSNERRVDPAKRDDPLTNYPE